MSKSIKVTINTVEGTDTEVKEWPIIQSGNFVDHSRVSVEVDGISYSIVLDPEKPRVEVWNVDANNELKDIIAHFSLPSFNLK